MKKLKDMTLQDVKEVIIDTLKWNGYKVIDTFVAEYKGEGFLFREHEDDDISIIVEECPHNISVTIEAAMVNQGTGVTSKLCDTMDFWEPAKGEDEWDTYDEYQCGPETLLVRMLKAYYEKYTYLQLLEEGATLCVYRKTKVANFYIPKENDKEELAPF